MWYNYILLIDHDLDQFYTSLLKQEGFVSSRVYIKPVSKSVILSDFCFLPEYGFCSLNAKWEYT